MKPVSRCRRGPGWSQRRSREAISGTDDKPIVATISGDAPGSGAALVTGYDAEPAVSGLDMSRRSQL